MVFSSLSKRIIAPTLVLFVSGLLPGTDAGRVCAQVRSVGTKAASSDASGSAAGVLAGSFSGPAISILDGLGWSAVLMQSGLQQPLFPVALVENAQPSAGDERVVPKQLVEPVAGPAPDPAVAARSGRPWAGLPASLRRLGSGSRRTLNALFDAESEEKLLRILDDDGRGDVVTAGGGTIAPHNVFGSDVTDEKLPGSKPPPAQELVSQPLGFEKRAPLGASAYFGLGLIALAFLIYPAYPFIAALPVPLAGRVAVGVGAYALSWGLFFAGGYLGGRESLRYLKARLRRAPRAND